MNGWKWVPVEPTAEMNKAGMRWLTGIQHMRAGDKRSALNEAFKAMIDAAPVPPAGGEVEVLTVVTLGSFSAEELGEIDIEPQMSALERIQQQVVTNEDVALELVDRAHVTRLTAENVRLQAQVDNYKNQDECFCIEHGLHIQQLQSELTKAREFLSRVERVLYERGIWGTAQEIESFLAHQSAPATKDGGR